MNRHDLDRLVSEEVALNATRSGVRVAPPAAARRVAARALRVRAGLPPSRRGGLSPAEAGRQGIGSGVKRAVDIAAGRDVDAGQVHAFCQRFAGKEREAERKGLTLEESKVRQAWDLWGGWPMCRAAEKAVRKSPRG